jgi:hypothetical protein
MLCRKQKAVDGHAGAKEFGDIAYVGRAKLLHRDYWPAGKFRYRFIG